MPLILGAALARANLVPAGYRAFVDFPLPDHVWIGRTGDAPGRAPTVHFIINDMAMALFFALAGKQVRDAPVLRGGALRGSRALSPLIAALGGMAGPVAVFAGLAALLGPGAAGPATWLVLAGLLVGKPAGIFAFGWMAARPMGLGLPAGMSMRDLLALGCVASIGFTVSLFVASVAFARGPLQDAAKMGALLSVGAGAVSLLAGRALGITRSKG